MAVDVMQRKKKDQQRRQQDFDAKDKNKEKQQQQQQQQQLQEKEQNQEEQQEHRQLRNADISGVCLSFRTRCASSEVHQMKKTLKQSSLASQVKNGQQKEKENEKEKDAVGDQKSKVSLEAIHDKNVHFVKDKIKSVSNSGNSSPDYAADELIVPRVTTPSSSSSSSSSLSSSSPLSLQLSSSSFCSTLIPTTAISTTTVTLTTQVNQITDRECDDLLVQHQHPYQKRKQQSTIVTNINSKQGFCASTCSYFCRCCKQDKVPTVNNGVITTKTAAAAAAAQNKFIYPSIIKATTEQAYQNYQCPTGKLCCLKYVLSCTKATDVSATAGTCRRNSFTFAAHNQMTNNHLSTTTTTTTTTTTKGQQQITRESTPTNHSNSSTSSSSLLLSLSSSSPSSSSPSSLPSSLSLSLSCEGIGDDIGIGLNDEWEILMHLGRDHLIHVCHHYAEYGQRIAMQLPPAYSNNSNDCNKSNYCNKSIICLNFKGVTTTNIIEKFFITCIPLALEQEPQQQIQQQQQQQEQQQYEQLLENKTFPSTCITSSNLKKYAIFLWYLNPKHSLNYHSPVSSNDEDDDVSNFESIIEIPNTDIKWFGRVHHLTTPWSQILASREFLMYDAISDGYDEAFVIVNKMK
uniref:Uncharacterized protein n=1 Tax=Glossina pallidipes TaxID=7398 RepID=A0A1A9ZZR6_GLOPL